MIPTTRSSVNLDFRIAPSLQGASLSTLQQSENPGAGHGLYHGKIGKRLIRLTR
jgi:hypothetical protein